MTLSPISAVARWGAGCCPGNGTRRRRDVWRLCCLLVTRKTNKNIEATNPIPCVQRETHGNKETFVTVLFSVSPPSLLCLPVSVCVAGGVAGSWAAADEAHLRSIHSNHPLHKSLVVAPRRRRIIASSCYRHVLPYSALRPRRVQDLPASQHPAVPASIYLSCSPCRSSRYLPLLLTLPFQPVSTSPAHPAVPAGIYLSCLNKLC